MSEITSTVMNRWDFNYIHSVSVFLREYDLSYYRNIWIRDSRYCFVGCV